MDTTKRNLWTAFLGEAKANRVYTAFAMKAMEEGHPEVAQLFLEVAGAETAHAMSHLKSLGEIRTTVENLRMVVEEEAYESGQMYPNMIQQALDSENTMAADSFRLAMEREQYHLKLFAEALEQLERKLRKEGKPVPPRSKEPSQSLGKTEDLVEESRRPVLAEVEKEKSRIATLERIREVVFGMQDGLVSTVAVVSSVMAATGQRPIVFIAGVTSALAGMISMGTGSYLSSKAGKELRRSEVEKEAHELETKPEEEMAELIEIYRQEGLTLKEAQNLAQRVASDKDLWLKTLAEKELGLPVESLENPTKDALTMAVAFVLGAAVPMIPYLFLADVRAIPFSIGLTVAALFIVGVFKARITQKHPLYSGLEIMIIGSLSGLLGYGIGVLFPRVFGIDFGP